MMKSDFYLTAGNDQLSGWTEKRLQSNSKAKLAPKIDPGHCLVVCSLSDPLSFLNPVETITSEKYAQQIGEIH